MNRRFSALILSGLGAGALYGATLTPVQTTETAADPAAVDTYLAQLSETVPPPAAARLANQAPRPADPQRAPDPAKADRAERMVGAAFSVVR